MKTNIAYATKGHLWQSHDSQYCDASAKNGSTGRPIIGGGAGTGISAKCEEAGGIDLIVICDEPNSNCFRTTYRLSNADRVMHGHDKNLSVTDIALRARPGGSLNRVHCPLNRVIVDDDLQADLADQV